MRTSCQNVNFFRGARLSRRVGCSSERGIVLVLSLILLVVIALLSVATLKNVGSAESTAGNVRTTELATQSAEIALRHCEASVVRQMTIDAGGESSYPTTFTDANILPATEPPQWQKQTLWDSSSDTVFVLPLALLNNPGLVVTTYKRPSECMVEKLSVASGSDPSSFFVITARGFGPDVAAVEGPVRPRPAGSEVWFQSVVKLGVQ